ncbi:hypothetical protein OG21DRAFT_241781 [Imleria badia]|nr:hypothetical protein OG21DRAFT_241781 [Imleria badia]
MHPSKTFLEFIFAFLPHTLLFISFLPLYFPISCWCAMCQRRTHAPMPPHYSRPCGCLLLHRLWIRCTTVPGSITATMTNIFIVLASVECAHPGSFMVRVIYLACRDCDSRPQWTVGWRCLGRVDSRINPCAVLYGDEGAGEGRHRWVSQLAGGESGSVGGVETKLKEVRENWEKAEYEL